MQPLRVISSLKNIFIILLMYFETKHEEYTNAHFIKIMVLIAIKRY